MAIKQKKYSSQLPKGWTLAEIEAVRKHYESQTDEEAAAEDDAMAGTGDDALMTIPITLVPRVRKMVAQYHRAQNSNGRKMKSKPRTVRPLRK